ncbi:MAG: serine hydrolase [Candidatus Kapabacteria bacterium]|nr:serine hydrolase [Candidatus Kapabacteria bacterium]
MQHTLATLTFLVLSTSVWAQEPMQRRLNDVCTMLSGKSMQFDTVFAPEFLEKVPPMQLTMVVQQITKESGGCVSTRIVESLTAFRAKAEALTVNGYSIPISIGISEKPPYLIEGLFLKPPVKTTGDLTSILADLKALPGSTSFYAKNLSTGKVVAAADTSLYLPTGSTFKIWILGELARSVIAGEHRWEETTTLDSSRYSLPSGVLQTWPHGAPVTLHTLASEMISISDNTATDALLHYLDPVKVFKVQSIMGHSSPELNDPFFSTRDLFMLKFSDSGKRASIYATLKPKERAQFLTSMRVTLTNSDVNFVETPVLPALHLKILRRHTCAASSVSILELK